MRRILALWLPRFSTDRLKRKDASLCDASPLVIAGRANNALYVQALDELGLYKGQPLANARAMVPALTIRPAEDNKDRALLEQIADWCDRFSPFVATAPRDGLLIDITGAAHLFGGEAAMLNHVSGKIAGQGFAVQAAIAGTAPAAQALARFAPNHIAAPGTEEQALARLPVAALAADEKIIAALRRAGLKTIEQVVARQRDGPSRPADQSAPSFAGPDGRAAFCRTHCHAGCDQRVAAQPGAKLKRYPGTTRPGTAPAGSVFLPRRWTGAAALHCAGQRRARSGPGAQVAARKTGRLDRSARSRFRL
jgi:hypothetical protein